MLQLVNTLMHLFWFFLGRFMSKRAFNVGHNTIIVNAMTKKGKYVHDFEWMLIFFMYTLIGQFRVIELHLSFVGTDYDTKQIQMLCKLASN